MSEYFEKPELTEADKIRVAANRVHVERMRKLKAAVAISPGPGDYSVGNLWWINGKHVLVCHKSEANAILAFKEMGLDGPIARRGSVDAVVQSMAMAYVGVQNEVQLDDTPIIIYDNDPEQLRSQIRDVLKFN